MSSTAFVAWWGAILSTIVLLWDIYKYRHAGPKLRFSVQTGMETNVPQYEGKTLILVKVSNSGDRATTITKLGCLYFTKRWRAIIRRTKPDRPSIVLTPSSAEPLPYELKAGGIWTGFIVQEPDVEQRARTGFLYVVLYHSHSKKPIRQRAVIEDTVSATKPDDTLRQGTSGADLTTSRP